MMIKFTKLGVNVFMSFFISISFDYGAEEFFWKTKFTNSKELIKWWLEEAQLTNLEDSLRSHEDFIPIIHDRNDDDDDYSFLIYELFLNNPFQISLIDAIDDLSYLLVENQKIYKNGKTEQIDLDTKIDLSIFGLD